MTNKLYRRFIDYLQSKNPEYEAVVPVSRFSDVLQDIANKQRWDKDFKKYLREGNRDITGLFRSNNDELCFYYTQDENYYQAIRLPMYFRDVQFPSQSTGYQKSDGTWVKLSERIQEEWTLTTDWLEAKHHKALKFALSHDIVIVANNMSINGKITSQNNYQIQWENKTRPYPLAKGTCKVNTTLNTCSVNSNC